MNLRTYFKTYGPRYWKGGLVRLFVILSLLLGVFGPLSFSTAPRATAASSTPINLIVVEYFPDVVPDGTTSSGSYPTTGTYDSDLITPGIQYAPIADFAFIVNVDNTGDPSSPVLTDHTGMRPMPSYSPIAFAGDETTPDFTEAVAFYPAFVAANPLGRYLVSVRAPGYKLWGAHLDLFDDPATLIVDTTPDADPSTLELDVVIGLIKDPLPLSNLRVFVFHDRKSVNSAPTGAEPDLAGFHVEIEDAIGDVTVDWFGNPICSQYYQPGFAHPDFGVLVANPDLTEPLLGGYIDPIEGFIPVPIAHTGGKCVTEADGAEGGISGITIRYLPYGQYDVKVVPPEPESVDSATPNTSRRWLQTSTFEGTLALEHVRLDEGTEGFGATYEAAREGLILPTAFWYGFVQECAFGDPDDNCPTNDVAGPSANTITGTVRDWTGWPPFEEIVYNEPVYKPAIALSGIGADDFQVYTAHGNADGTFEIPNVPPGTYQMTIWDDPLDYIITYRTVTMPAAGGNVDMGEIGIFRWFGWSSGYVFLDTGILEDGTAGGVALNSIRDCADMVAKTNCERGIPGVDLDLRFRDGSVKKATFTDENGYYEYEEELGPMFKFDIAEVGYGRFQQTGHSWHSDLLNNPEGDHDGDLIPNAIDPDLATPAVVDPSTGGGLLLNMLTLEGKRNWIDWGKRPYDTTDPTEHGGITGITLYATTRNEFEARLAAAEDYEPGIPSVTVKLWSVLEDIDGNPILDVNGMPQTNVVLNEVQTDAWEQPSGCDVTNKDGLLLSASTAGAQTALYDFVYLFHDILNPAPTILNPTPTQCIEYPLLSNEVRPGAFDGGYAFSTICTGGIVGDVCSGEVPMPAGNYIVEAVPPPYYQILKEEDQNTDEGDDLVPIPLFPPPPCVGDLHLVDDSRNPFDGDNMPLCNKKFVRVQRGQNPAADFFFFTDIDANPATNVANPDTNGIDGGSWTTTESVPIPGRYLGLVTDDFVRDLNPNSLWYGEERPLSNVPIGIRDFTGRLFTTVTSDENGWYEALMPSTFQANCPIPTGICPGMYIVRVNDPGDLIPSVPPDAPIPGAANANYRSNYLTEPAPFQVWPGKMTKLDTPIDPTGWWSCATLDNPAIDPADPLFGMPVHVEFFVIDQVYGPPGTTVTLTGLKFGAVQGAGTLTLDGVPIPVTSWTNEQIIANIPSGTLPGPHQLLVTADSGVDAFTGITFHVIDGDYDPTIVDVFPPLTPGTPVIQPAIDAAGPGTLIVVHPGSYHESPILHGSVKLQGFGPGGIAGANNPLDPITAIEEPRFNVKGSMIEGRFFESYRMYWEGVAFGLDPTLPTGAAVTVLTAIGGEEAEDAALNPLLDGFWVTGGRGDFGGGGVHVDHETLNLQISNNILEANGGARGGGISLGRLLTADNNNDNVRISFNRVINNGSVAQGAGIAVFAGANGYRINNNDICGNYAGEYGGGISHFGLSGFLNAGNPASRIDHNQIRLNDAFDEGGGILLGGNNNFNAGLGFGSGEVDITQNEIRGNFSNDDGGGIRLLVPRDDRINIVNNIIAHNMAADHGGGIALDDASNVTIINNTIARNFSTSTAVDSIQVPSPLGPLPRTEPRGAGLTSEEHSDAFKNFLYGTTTPNCAVVTCFSDPAMFNNIFESNQSFFFDPNVAPTPETGVDGTFTQPLIPAGPTGAGDPPTSSWDLEVIYDGVSGSCFSPTFTMFASDPDANGAIPGNFGGIPSQPYGPNDLNGCMLALLAAPGNTVGQDPMFLQPRPYEEFNAITSLLDPNFVSVQFWRAEGGEGFIMAADWHVRPTSPAIDAGSNKGPDPINGPYPAPCDDIDDDGRPFNGIWDIGADEQPGLPVSPLCSTSSVLLYFSTDTSVTPPGVVDGDDANIYTWDGGFFGLVFNASGTGGAGLTSGTDVDAVVAVDADTFYLSFKTDAGTTVPTLGTVQDEDIVKYDAGAWSLYFDGSDVGLGCDPSVLGSCPTTGNIPNEDVDAFEILSDGSVLVSTTGAPVIPALAGGITEQDEDLLRCVGTFGPATTCAWSDYFDGSDIGLATTAFEDVDGVAVASNGDIYLSTEGSFAVTGGFSNGGEDVWICRSPVTGPVSSCRGPDLNAALAADNFSLYYNGAGLSANDLDAFDLP